MAQTLLVFCAAAGVGAGCHKDEESLIVVQLALATDVLPRTAEVESVTLAANRVPGNRTFRPASLSLSSTVPISFGLYIGAGITGTVEITATVTSKSGGPCFSGNGKATVTPGATVPLDIAMSPDACHTDGGGADGFDSGGSRSGGSGGGMVDGGGLGGSAGTGGLIASGGNANTGGSTGTGGT
ncbi:MAG: hypothetical protein ABJA82_06715, partial [Myxococcales bacterium]